MITGAVTNKKKGGGQFFSLNYRTATKKVSARPISLYWKMSDFIPLLHHSQTQFRSFFCLCKTRIVSARWLIRKVKSPTFFLVTLLQVCKWWHVQMSNKHGRWLDGTLFRGRALMHFLSRKNISAIDMLRSVVCSIGAVSSTQWQHHASSYRHSGICSNLQPTFTYQNCN